jgi:GH18 family chitinase
VFNEEQKVPYAYKGAEWVSFDNIKSIKLKAEYIMDNNLGGAMVWALDTDDFDGKFCNQGKYPLINTIKSVMSGTFNDSIIIEPELTTTLPTTTTNTTTTTSTSTPTTTSTSTTTTTSTSPTIPIFNNETTPFTNLNSTNASSTATTNNFKITQIPLSSLNTTISSNESIVTTLSILTTTTSAISTQTTSNFKKTTTNSQIISNKNKKLVCYYTNWSQYRPGVGRFVPENVDPFLCTHIIYAFAKVDEAGNLKPFEWNDQSTEWSRGMYDRTMDLKKKNPNLKILLAAGGIY